MLKTPRSLGQKRLEVLCGAKRMKQHEKNLRSLEMASPMTRGHQEDPRRSKKFKMNAPADKKSPEPKSQQRPCEKQNSQSHRYDACQTQELLGHSAVYWHEIARLSKLVRIIVHSVNSPTRPELNMWPLGFDFVRTRDVLNVLCCNVADSLTPLFTGRRTTRGPPASIRGTPRARWKLEPFGAWGDGHDRSRQHLMRQVLPTHP
jgi:hypothetical protein